MPMGIVIMHWDERTGVEILARYPEEIDIQDKTLMQLYSQHEFSGEAGMVTLSVGASNLASYYTGAETAIYIIVALSLDEDGDSYEEGLVEVSRTILANLNASTLTTLLPPLFQRLSVYPTLNQEQRIGMIFQNDIKRMILKRLREEIFIPKSELTIWLRDQYQEGFVDSENIVASLIQAGIVKVASVKGITSDVIFLVEDFFMLRRPPIDLIKNPSEHHLPEVLKQSYLNEVKSFFANYKPSEEDNMKIADQVLLNPANYEVLKLLREAMVTRNDLEKLKKKGVDDLDSTLKIMWENKLIAVFRDDKSTEYYCLVSDFVIERFFPRYSINIIRTQYKNRAQNPNALLKALDLLKEEYIIMQKGQKQPQAQAQATVQ
jgi:hypothetical protein